MKTGKTKKRFLLSLVAVIACVAMLIGTTMAWFTDSVSNTGNRIQAGTLDIDLLMDKGTEEGYVSIADGQGDIFKEADNANDSNATLWEPGKTQFAKLAVENKGSLAVKYTAYIDVVDEGLVGSLEYAMISANAPTPTTGYDNWEAVKTAVANAGGVTGDVNSGRNIIATGVLDEIVNGTQNEKDYVLLAVHMKETAGNEYQGKDCIIDVTIVATQKDAEADAFGTTYDVNATGPVPGILIRDKVSTNPVSEAQTGEISFNTDGTSIENASVNAGALNTILDAAKAENPEKDVAVALNMNIDSAGKTENSVTYDISMSKTVTVKKDNVLESESTEDVTDLGENNIATARVELGKGIKNVIVRHKHGSETTTMQKYDNDTFTSTGYNYNSETGILTIKSQKFSDFIVSFDMDIADVDTIDALKNCLKTGGLVKLTANIGSESEFQIVSETNIVKIEKGNTAVLDLCGHQMYLATNVDGETSAFRVNNGATFTIKDSVGGGAIYYKDEKDNTGGFVVCNEGTFNLYGGHLENKTICVNSAVQGTVDVHTNKWGDYVQKPTVFNMYGGEIVSQTDNTLRLYDSSQVSKDVNVTINIYDGKVQGADAVFIQPLYNASAAHHEKSVQNETTNKYYVNIYGGQFNSKNGIRVFAEIANAKDFSKESSDRGISLNVIGGNFVNTIGDSDKARSSKGVAMQNNYVSDADAVKIIGTYLVQENIKSGININPEYIVD